MAVTIVTHVTLKEGSEPNGMAMRTAQLGERRGADCISF